jgi:tRNA threonylcarbamoyladenosine biosynthesis protein TsaB
MPKAPRAAPTLLAFDTATELMSLALLTHAGSISRSGNGGAQASAALVPALLAMLAEAGSSLQGLDAIAYGRGPGAFTGLRTACSVAQGLAFGAGKPVIALDSLMLVAEAVRSAGAATEDLSLWVAQDARMDEVYAAEYRWQGERPGRWQTRVAPALYTLPALNARWAEAAPQAVVGSALAVMGERLATGAAQRLAEPSATERARALAVLALASWDDGDLLDAAEALPLYLRDKVALTTAEREAVRAAKDLA